MRIIALCVLISALFFSCENKSCQDVVCPGLNSTCFDGNCVCVSGYEGDFCDILSYQKYVGSYQVSESCTTTFAGLQNQQYSSSINVGFTIDVLTINNFAGYGTSVDATIVSANFLTITSQNAGALQVSGGQGNYEPFANRIVLEYNFTAGTNFHQCTAVFTRF